MAEPKRKRLDITALAARMACSHMTVYRWYTTRDFPRPHFLGQKRLWWEDEVESWEERQMLDHSSNEAEATDSFFTKSGSSPPNTTSGEGGES